MQTLLSKLFVLLMFFGPEGEGEGATPTEPTAPDKIDENLDEFAAAFDDAMKDVAFDAPTYTPPAAEATPPAAEATPAAAPAPPPSEVTTLQQQITTLSAELAALKAAPQTAEVQAAAAAVTEELAWLDGEFSADWPDIKKAIDIAVKAALNKVQGQVQSVTDAVTPIVQQSQAQTFYTELVKLVPDVDAVRDGFVGWVKQQPDAIKKSYTTIVETGTPAETAALIDMYKQLHAIQTPQPPTPPPSASARLRNMEDLGSRKTATTHSARALDFDAAFAEAAADPSIQ